jgi:hypothetical protein
VDTIIALDSNRHAADIHYQGQIAGASPIAGKPELVWPLRRPGYRRSRSNSPTPSTSPGNRALMRFGRRLVMAWL